MFNAPELWDWDEGHGYTRPYCLAERCALWDETGCSLRRLAVYRPLSAWRLQTKAR